MTRAATSSSGLKNKYSDVEKKSILGKVVEIAVRTTFQTHFYQWGGKIYRQQRGGPIGLKASGTVAGVAMEVWIREFKRILVAAGVEVHLLSKYVDDVLIILGGLAKGSRWSQGKVIQTEETTNEDAEKDIQEVTLQVLKTAANSVTPYLKFTGEVAQGERAIAVLDTTVWYGDKRSKEKWFHGDGVVPGGEGDQGRCIQYLFYQKSMTNKLGILKRSAISEGTKVSTACAEVMRRLKNTSMFASREQVEEVLTEYMDNLIGMGYDEDWRTKVLSSSIKGYRRILGQVREGKTQRNREGASTRTSRRWGRLMGPSTWFKKVPSTVNTGQGGGVKGKRKQKGDRVRPEAVMFVPTTPEGTLKRRLQEME